MVMEEMAMENYDLHYRVQINFSSFTAFSVNLRINLWKVKNLIMKKVDLCENIANSKTFL